MLTWPNLSKGADEWGPMKSFSLSKCLHINIRRSARKVSLNLDPIKSSHRHHHHLLLVSSSGSTVQWSSVLRSLVSVLWILVQIFYRNTENENLHNSSTLGNRLVMLTTVQVSQFCYLQVRRPHQKLHQGPITSILSCCVVSGVSQVTLDIGD